MTKSVRYDWKFAIRLALPIAAIIIAVGMLSGPLAERLILAWSEKDVTLRTRLVASSLGEGFVTELPSENSPVVRRGFERLVKNERLYALGFCDLQGRIINKSAAFFGDYKCPDAASGIDGATDTIALPGGERFFVSHTPVHTTTEDATQIGSLITVHSLDYAMTRASETRAIIGWATLIAAAVIALLAFSVAEATRRLWIRALRRTLSSGQDDQAFEPILKDVRGLIAQMEEERKTWNADAIRQLIKAHMKGNEIFVISNREPYVHHKKDDGSIHLERPASGLVTALEPIVGVCNGTWIAHGGGSGDRETVDDNDSVMMPPENPSFRLKRVWLTEEEREGHYNGFSNGALWPLCHLTHTRPVFRTADWDMYKAVNQKFADALVAEVKTKNPLVLVQDYHFALLPRMIRDRLPDANIITFWHIPWPNAEMFNICPWKDELLDGLLGSQIIGFHTSGYVRNFQHAIASNLEARVNFVNGDVAFKSSVTRVAAYPMSIDWASGDKTDGGAIEQARRAVLAENDLPSSTRIGIGIDRLDYSKGILERFQAVERMMENNPNLRGSFSFIQIAAPSRTDVPAYQEYAQAVRNEAARINRRFESRIPLIILREFHHDKDEVYRYYRAANLCFVSSLHDGMNLVAKEFVAARTDEQGVLILSEFTGAAGDLPDALLVNPYHIDACAQALTRAVTMHPNEQAERMKAMRRQVREHNIFRWAGYLLLDSAELQRLHGRKDDVITLNPTQKAS